MYQGYGSFHQSQTLELDIHFLAGYHHLDIPNLNISEVDLPSFLPRVPLLIERHDHLLICPSLKPEAHFLHFP